MKPDVAEPGAAAEPRRVLVVDDSATHRSLVRVFLGGAGYELVEASDVARAMQILATERIDLVITDLNMPVADGVALITQIRESRDQRVRSLPIVVLTAERSIEYRARSVAAGAEVVCRKPVSQAGLLEVVERYMRVDPSRQR